MGNEDQKSGIDKTYLNDFYKFCKNLDLDIIGTMCIPPTDGNTEKYFSEMDKINQELNFKEKIIDFFCEGLVRKKIKN